MVYNGKRLHEIVLFHFDNTFNVQLEEFGRCILNLILIHIH